MPTAIILLLCWISHDEKLNSKYMQPYLLLHQLSLFRQQIDLIFCHFYFSFNCCWFCWLLLYTTLIFSPTCHLLSLWGSCAPTLAPACCDTFPDRLLNPLQLLIIPLCLCFYCGRQWQKELRVRRLTPYPRAVCAASHSFVLVIQIIVLMPIRSITSGEHEDITTPTYSKWMFAWHSK